MIKFFKRLYYRRFYRKLFRFVYLNRKDRLLYESLHAMFYDLTGHEWQEFFDPRGFHPMNIQDSVGVCRDDKGEAQEWKKWSSRYSRYVRRSFHLLLRRRWRCRLLPVPRPILLLRQWQRYRSLSFQESCRYCLQLSSENIQAHPGLLLRRFWVRTEAQRRRLWYRRLRFWWIPWVPFLEFAGDSDDTGDGEERILKLQIWIYLIPFNNLVPAINIII